MPSLHSATRKAENFRSESARLKTFAKHPGKAVSSLALTEAGFVRLSSSTNEDLVQCPFCHLTCKNLKKGDQPLAWHRTLGLANCPFLQKKGFNICDLSLKSQESFGQYDSAVTSNDNVIILPLAGSFDDHSMADVTEAQRREQLSTTYAMLSKLSNEVSSEHLYQIKKSSNAAPPLLNSNVTQRLNYESHRIASFKDKWPRDHPLTPGELAAAGFFYKGPGDMVECTFCHGMLSKWSKGLSAANEHRSKFNYCRFILGQPTENVPLILNDQESPSALSWLAENDTDERLMSGELGIITDTTKYPEFAIKSRRDLTFVTWPPASKKLAWELSPIGLFYTGTEDCVCCYSCGKEMSNWSDTDDVWIRHAVTSPSCQVVLQEKGSAFITEAVANPGIELRETPPALSEVVPRMLRPRMEYRITQAALSLNFNPDLIKQAITEKLKKKNEDFESVEALIGAVILLHEVQSTHSPPPFPVTMDIPEVVPWVPQESERGQVADSEPASETIPFDAVNVTVPSSSVNEDIKESARVLKAQYSCKICMDAPVGIVFIPCGHLVCCPNCAPAMIQCPICRQDVKGTVKANL